MKRVVKFFKWMLDGGGASSTKEFQELQHIMNTKTSENVFAEIDNDLKLKIDKATNEFKQAQLRHIPCQILYYSKFEIKSTIAMTRLFLIKRKRIIQGCSIRLENGRELHSGSYHENTNYIKYKGK